MRSLFAAAFLAAVCWLPTASPVEAQYYGYGYDLYSDGLGYGYGYGNAYGYNVYSPYVYGRNYTPRYSTYYADGLYGNYYTTPWWYR